MDPYAILGVLSDADDDSVRKAYLDFVRQFSPDRNPEKFKKISEAYEILKMKNHAFLITFTPRIPWGTPRFGSFCNLNVWPKRESRRTMNK